jgi:hypothetical protein
MDPTVRVIINELKEGMPPIVDGKALDRLSGEALRWNQVQAWIDTRDIPADCFCFDGRKILIYRDRLLEW